MNKTEVRNKIIETVNYYDNHRSFSLDELNEIVDKKLDEYAQQEAVEFAMWNEHFRIDKELYEETYQDWKKENQQ